VQLKCNLFGVKQQNRQIAWARCEREGHQTHACALLVRPQGQFRCSQTPGHFSILLYADFRVAQMQTGGNGNLVPEASASFRDWEREWSVVDSLIFFLPRQMILNIGFLACVAGVQRRGRRGKFDHRSCWLLNFMHAYVSVENNPAQHLQRLVKSAYEPSGPSGRRFSPVFVA